ncbi:hypothetical protein DVT68_00030 [Dyella solisilvae]|uniref:Uncharacterized protein n=2 Tax=Dyella solisilvae TaxID=1920168 RepID=A0A370K9I0_9GAMM|nr:hypothetical protein DVT68_00030 [Dyella solisilvae]
MVVAIPWVVIATSGLTIGTPPTIFDWQPSAKLDYASVPGENHESFVQRLEEKLKAWAGQTGRGVCGPLARTNESGYCAQ